MKFTTVLVALFSVTLLVGCSHKKKTLSGDENTAQTLTDGSGVDSSTYNADGSLVTEYNPNNNQYGGESQLGDDDNNPLMQRPEFSDPNSPLSKRVIYFEYDSSQVKNEFVPILEAHANYLMANPNQRITLEGNTDERGTREYNIALGEQRAKTVFKMLQLIGVRAGQMDVVSYGEEKPVELGHSEESFSLNRRVEIVYR
ncbi:MAG: peptidoglycan-associated lipoprotein Pal [Methylococcaceae bacterium]|nr:peptidoglycan-associated lipoprotein Pal [Methylococcaceae bacterium]